MDWISCSQRLPEDDRDVFVWSAESKFFEGGAAVAFRRGGTWICDEWPRFTEQDPNVFVTHWAEFEAPANLPTPSQMSDLLGEDL